MGDKGGGFKHIKVTVAEGDDEVIVAGAIDAGRPASEAAAASEPESSSGEVLRPQPRGDAFHEAALEDLEGTKMPLTQKIVIIAAVVCIIGALLYYFVAMR